MEAPERIYLQVSKTEEDDDWDDEQGVTWCVDRIYDSDAEYVQREAAVKLWRQRYSDRTVIAHRRACALVKGRNITDEDIHQLVMQDPLLRETAFLADSPEAAEENGESET